ncbi:MAG TPA: hypothetical protein VLL52_14575, partial [Anaerolineae bacterium]|nr:hypothetical protein [Anaerolineae bacterium]
MRQRLTIVMVIVILSSWIGIDGIGGGVSRVVAQVEEPVSVQVEVVDTTRFPEVAVVVWGQLNGVGRPVTEGLALKEDGIEVGAWESEPSRVGREVTIVLGGTSAALMLGLEAWLVNDWGVEDSVSLV